VPSNALVDWSFVNTIRVFPQMINLNRRAVSLRTARSLGAFTLSSLFFLSPNYIPFAAAQELVREGESLVPEIVIFADRLKGRAQDIASALTIIDAETIERSGATTVAEVLRTQPGINVIQSGPAGGNVSVFIRGANAEHTLVLVDGILMNNPVTPSRLFNLANVPLDNVERIEIIRGPQSSLYGSDALGGVISIITKRGQSEPSATLEAEGGSFGTGRFGASRSGQQGDINYSVALSQDHTDGVSAADQRDGNREKDGNDVTGFAGQLSYTPSERFSLRSTLRVNQSETEIDNFGGVGGDDPNRKVDNRTIAASVVAEGGPSSGIIKPSLGFTIADHALDDNNDPDTLHPDDLLRSSYDGRLMKGFGTVQVDPFEAVSAIAGIEVIEELAQSSYQSESAFGPYNEDIQEKSARTNGGFLQVRGRPIEGLVLEGSARLDDNQRFDPRGTWRFAPQYVFGPSATKIRASVGTGYKAPSLYQIFSPYGDRNLLPERSVGWDVGFQQSFCDQDVVFEANYFNNQLTNLINFDPTTFLFQNINEARTRGVEVTARWSISSDFDFLANYTYTDPTDAETGQRLLRRARNIADLSSTYRFAERYTLSGGYTWVGERLDLDFSGSGAERIGLAGYGLLRIVARVELTERLLLNMQLNNVLDKNYNEVNGYGTFGFGAYAGLRFRFSPGV
jgi:vitamin B12 transporter